MKERIQKVLARFNLGSRRLIESKILKGQILVNGKLAQLGQKIDADDQVQINDQKLVWPLTEKSTMVLLFHKSEGLLCSRSSQKKQALIFDHVPKPYDHFNLVGRLDLNSSGLILLTNDGQLLYRLTHPKYQVPRTYLVRVNGDVNGAMIQQIKKGIWLESDLLKVDSIHRVYKKNQQSSNSWFKMSLKEGKNREIRRIWEYFGCRVSRLIRIQYGPIYLPQHLEKNHFILLSEQEVDKLKQCVNLESL